MAASPTDTTEQQSAQTQIQEDDPADIITLLQKKHAPPQPFVVNEVLGTVTEHPEWGAITDTPRVLKEQMQSIQSLIDQLPPLQEEDVVMKDILDLIEQSNQLDMDLSAELAKAEDVLYEGQLSTAALSLHELQVAATDSATSNQNSAEPGSSAMQA